MLVDANSTACKVGFVVKNERKQLEPWQRADAARLKALFDANAGMSQEKFGQTHGIGSQGAVWQYLEGKIPLNLPVVLKFARGLGVQVVAISPTLAREIGETHEVQDGAIKNYSTGPEIRANVPLISWANAVKWLESIEVSRDADAEDWYPMPRQAGPSTYCLRVEGDSMTAQYGKSYPAGSIIFVDPHQRAPANGKRVLAKLKASNEIAFRVFVQEAGRTFLKPLNAHYPPIFEEFTVIGTVVGKWEDD